MARVRVRVSWWSTHWKAKILTKEQIMANYKDVFEGLGHILGT